MSDVTLYLENDEAKAVLSVLGRAKADGFGGLSTSMYNALCFFFDMDDRFSRSTDTYVIPMEIPGEKNE